VDKVTTVGGVAKHFGVSTVTVRKWEDKAGVTPIREEMGGRRLYSTKDIKAIEAWRDTRPQRTGGDD